MRLKVVFVIFNHQSMFTVINIFLSCSTYWDGSIEIKFVILRHYAQFLQTLKHHCPPFWHNSSSKSMVLGLFGIKLCFILSECGLYESYSSQSFFWYQNQGSLTLKYNFMRQNRHQNQLKCEAEGSFWYFNHHSMFTVINIYFYAVLLIEAVLLKPNLLF